MTEPQGRLCDSAPGLGGETRAVRAPRPEQPIALLPTSPITLPREGPAGPRLEAALGGWLVLAHAGGTRLYLLNPMAAWMWAARVAGIEDDRIATALAARFGVSAADARADVRHLLGQWRRAGLLDPPPNLAAMEHLPQPPVAAEPIDFAAAEPWRLRVADQGVALVVGDAALAALLAPVVAHLSEADPRADASADPRPGAEHRLALTGQAGGWTLHSDGIERARGETIDAALTLTIAELIELGCQGPERMLVVHGAGLVYAGGAVLLVGRGGSGKTTLAAALNAMGMPLLGDDVVPVTAEGQALGIGMSLCLKAGSWPVLAERLPALGGTPVWQRAGEPVRFVPPPGPVAHGPVPVGALLFPEYVPGRPAAIEPLAPEAVLQRLIAAEPYLPPLTQARLDALVAWVAAAPGVALRYPSLDEGIAQVGAALAAAGSGGREVGREREAERLRPLPRHPRSLFGPAPQPPARALRLCTGGAGPVRGRAGRSAVLLSAQGPGRYSAQPASALSGRAITTPTPMPSSATRPPRSSMTNWVGCTLA